MRVFIPLALAASTVATFNQRHQDSPLVILGHPPQDSIDFAGHPLRVLKVQGQNGKNPRNNRVGARPNGGDYRVRKNNPSASGPVKSKYLPDKSRNEGKIEKVARLCGQVGGAVAGLAIGVPLCAVAGYRKKITGSKIGGAIVGALSGPVAGPIAVQKWAGENAAALGRKQDAKRAERNAAKKK
ncbi:unnamed protein product [Aphanomyces euteiches]